jgi:predicted ester cyclase
MAVEWNMAVVRRIIDGMNRWEPAVFDELFLSDVKDQNPLVDQAPGVEGIKATHSIYQNAFPDFYLSVEDLVAQGDKVVVRWTLHGTHCDEFLGIAATNRRILVTGIDIYRLREGKVAEWWHPGDREATKLQLTAPVNSVVEHSHCSVKVRQP